MPKRLQPDIAYRVKKHMSNGYVYASTQPLVEDAKTGKMVRRHKSWGTVDENLRFIPNRNYLSASKEERDKLIFPEDWDLSCIQTTLASDEETSEAFSIPVMASQNGKAFLYGGTWLLGQIAQKLSLNDSLIQAFWGDQEMVDDLLTLAMYTYLNRGDWHNLCSMQQVEYYPSEHPLTEPVIQTLLDYLSEERLLWFMEQRLKSHEGKELLVLESILEEDVSRPYLSWDLPKSLPRKAVLELVAYEQERFLPVWYQKVPVQLFGESLTEDALVGSPEQVQKGLWVFPRAFPSDYDLFHFLDKADKEGLRCLLPLSLNSCFARNLGSDINHTGLESNSQENTYLGLRCRSYPIVHEVKGENKKRHRMEKLRTNLYYEWQRGDLSLDSFKNELRRERELVGTIRDGHLPVEDKKALERRLPFLDLTFQSISRESGEGFAKAEGPWEVVSYQMNQDVMAGALKKESYYAILSLGNDLEGDRALDCFVRRGHQECLSRRLQGQMNYPTAPLPGRGEWAVEEIEDAGASFIRYLILLFDAYINHVLETTQLHQSFPNANALMDEIRTLSYRKDAKDQLVLDKPTQVQGEIIQAFQFTLEPVKKKRSTRRRKAQSANNQEEKTTGRKKAP